MTDHPTAPVQDDDAVDDFLREIYGRAFKEGAESTIEQWASGSNDDAPEMPHKDCENEGAYQFIADVKPRLSRLSPTPETGLVEARELKLLRDIEALVVERHALRTSLAEVLPYLEEGYMDDEDDDEPVGWAADNKGGNQRPMALTFGMVRRARAALSNVLPDEV